MCSKFVNCKHHTRARESIAYCCWKSGCYSHETLDEDSLDVRKCLIIVILGGHCLHLNIPSNISGICEKRTF